MDKYTILHLSANSFQNWLIRFSFYARDVLCNFIKTKESEFDRARSFT